MEYQYEIMFIISAKKKVESADKLADQLSHILKETKDFKMTKLGLKDLAYKIKHNLQGYYYVFNFSCSNTTLINEFKRLISLKNDVIRFMIINLNKEYGYKATVNQKKIKRSKFRAERYQRIKESILNHIEKIKKEKDHTAVKLTDI